MVSEDGDGCYSVEWRLSVLMLKWSLSWYSISQPFLRRDSFVFLDNFSLINSQNPRHKNSNQWKASLPLKEWGVVGLKLHTYPMQ